MMTEYSGVKTKKEFLKRKQVTLGISYEDWYEMKQIQPQLLHEGIRTLKDLVHAMVKVFKENMKKKDGERIGF